METGHLRSKLASKSTPISELWVQLRDPVSENKVENSKSALGLYTHMQTHSHLSTRIEEHTNHIHTYTVFIFKKALMHTSSNTQTLSLVAVFLRGTFQLKQFINVLQLPTNELGEGLVTIPPPWQAQTSVTVPAGVPWYQWCFKHDSTKRSVSRQDKRNLEDHPCTVPCKHTDCPMLPSA